jgi:hypothetical protein
LKRSPADILQPAQIAVAKRFSFEPLACPGGSIAGVALQTFTPGRYPLNGLRHPATETTCGWYLWAGEELSDDPEFFQPLHVDHLSETVPEVMPYLGIPPGGRFLIAPGHEDVWFDESLLDVD